MKALRSGLGPVSDEIFELAEALLNRLPDDAYLLTGVTLAEEPAAQERATIDLIAITNTAVIVGMDVGRYGPNVPTPKQAGRLVARVQQDARLSPGLLIFPCWLGDAIPAGNSDQSAVLSHSQAVFHFTVRASEQAGQPAPEAAATLAERLLQSDAGPLAGTRRAGAVRGFRKVLQDLGDLPGRVDAGLQDQIRQPLALRRAEPIRPADVNRQLQEVMFARENLLEDANYGKIIPNDFIVELNGENYERQYRPIEAEVCQQWQEKLLDALNTANGRLGRKEYRFSGPVRVRIQPVTNLAEDAVRIHSRVRAAGAGVGPSQRQQPCLELMPEGRHYPLRAGTITLGRDPICDIFVERPDVQEKRLVSSQHAFIVCERDTYRLFDGAPDGRPSVNGTYVNGRPVSRNGTALREGDVVVLAALDPQNPRPDRPGVAGFVFRQNC